MGKVLASSLIMVLLIGCSSHARELPIFGGTELSQQRPYINEYFTAHEGKALHVKLHLTDLGSIDRSEPTVFQISLFGADKKLMAQFSTSSFYENYCWLIPKTGV